MPCKKGFIIFFLFFTVKSYSQETYWQQQVNHTIDVSLNDSAHTLSAFQTIEYYNNSPDTLRYIWFHVWPNAYKNDKTSYSDQALENGSTKFYFSGKESKGYINRLNFKVNNITARVEDHPEHIDIIKVLLPSPLLPGSKLLITNTFHVKLPDIYSRSGHDGQMYQVTQWYPKPAVYDRKGWHPLPYLDQGEFYSEFGNYTVNITLPANYVVAATGELQNNNEKNWIKTRESFSWKPIRNKEKTAYGQIRNTYQNFPDSDPQTKTIQFKQDNVHDFAWFADKRFIVQQDSVVLSSGKHVTLATYYTTEEKERWQKSNGYSKVAVKGYSTLVGEYPYSTVSVVQGAKSFAGGMEYPTITVISPVNDDRTLEKIIIHEIGHNWFYGIIATNERRHPWMDEGMNSYYEDKLTARAGEKPQQLTRLVFESKVINRTAQPIKTPAEQFNSVNYGLVAYYKSAEWMRYLENQLGTEEFNRAMQEYYKRWKFRHPSPEDFKKSFEQSTGRNLDSAFALLTTNEILPGQQRMGSIITPAFNFKKVDQYLKNPTQNLIMFGPLLGINSYDKIILMGFLTNMKLPPSRFQFLLVPGYATGSKKFTGIGTASYSFFTSGIIREIEPVINGSVFTMHEFTPPGAKKLYQQYRKIAPGIRLTLREQPRSTALRSIQFRSFFISEDGLRFSRDSIFNGPDTTIVNSYGTNKTHRSLYQLKLITENNRALYPYRGELKMEQGEGFVRAAFTGNYFFNYEKQGGLNVRLFAGKFFYTGSKTIAKQFATDRYHLNMTGPNGYEDYTYSDYFAGRNRFEGLLSQQIMVRDGAFKVRTDLLADEVGKTDNWLIAANFNTTIPSSINPFNLLPLKIPLRVFADVGTYADAWEDESGSDRFLYDVGLQIPLFKETVNFYLPVLYSKVYREYNRSTLPKKGRIWKTVSFSIDISNFSFRKIDRNLQF